VSGLSNGGPSRWGTKSSWVEIINIQIRLNGLHARNTKNQWGRGKLGTNTLRMLKGRIGSLSTEGRKRKSCRGQNKDLRFGFIPLRGEECQMLRRLYSNQASKGAGRGVKA